MLRSAQLPRLPLGFQSQSILPAFPLANTPRVSFTGGSQPPPQLIPGQGADLDQVIDGFRAVTYLQLNQ